MPDSKDNPSPDITLLLQSIGDGDQQAAAELLPVVYEELRSLARARMRHLAAGQTIQPTALVHEAYMKLVGDEDPGWNNRGHFFGAAAQAMRELLVDHARRRSRLKRGGGRGRVELTDEVAPSIRLSMPGDDLLALDEALDRLREHYPRTAEVVMLRMFAGLPLPQVAEAIGESVHTAGREWRFAIAWFHRDLEGEASELDNP